MTWGGYIAEIREPGIFISDTVATTESLSAIRTVVIDELDNVSSTETTNTAKRRIWNETNKNATNWS